MFGFQFFKLSTHLFFENFKEIFEWLYHELASIEQFSLRVDLKKNFFKFFSLLLWHFQADEKLIVVLMLFLILIYFIFITFIYVLILSISYETYNYKYLLIHSLIYLCMYAVQSAVIEAFEKVKASCHHKRLSNNAQCSIDNYITYIYM